MDIRTLAQHGIIAGVVAATLLFSACGESSKPDFTGLVPEGAPQVGQSGLKFSPNQVTVNAGDRVYFTNSETALHKVAVDGEAVTDDMHRGDVATFTFTTPGEYELTCPYHPQMKATVTVE